MPPQNTFLSKLITSVASALIVALIGFFVWLANLSSRVSIIEQVDVLRAEASRRIDDANREALQRIEHEREANDARVRDDLRELRQKVFQ